MKNHLCIYRIFLTGDPNMKCLSDMNLDYYSGNDFSLPYLIAQIRIIKPKVLVALGKTAVDGLLGPDKNRRLGDVRGD